MKTLFSALTVSAVMIGAAHAAVIDFSGFSAGTIIDDEYAADGVTFSATGGAGHAVVFDTNNPTGNDGDLAAPFKLYNDPTTEITPGNILVISDNKSSVSCSATACTPADDEASGGVITAVFDSVVNFHGFNAFDVTDGGKKFEVKFYDVNDLLIGSILQAAPGVGDREYQAFDNLLYANVKKIEFIFGGSGGIDGLKFTEVPIPGALPLLLSGLALGGFVSRKRKKAAA